MRREESDFSKRPQQRFPQPIVHFRTVHLNTGHRPPLSTDSFANNSHHFPSIMRGSRLAPKPLGIPMHDLKLAIRQLCNSPGFAATVILTLALGIGANTAIFTLVHGILLKSLPVANPAALYRIGDLDDCCVNTGFINDNGDFDLFSNDLYRQFRESTPEFEQLAAFQSGNETMNVRRGSSLGKVEHGEFVSG